MFSPDNLLRWQLQILRLWFIIIAAIYSQTFVHVANLYGVGDCAVCWMDYDKDGDLDIFLSGVDVDQGNYQGSTIHLTTRIYRNDGGGVFTDININLPLARDIDWGDYDNDGDLDILMSGTFTATSSRILKNEGNGNFTEINSGISDIGLGAVDWGDIDNDGDLDFVITGIRNNADVALLFRNDGNNQFTEITSTILGVRYGSVDFGDSDNDGDLDLLISGHYHATNVNICEVYLNDGNGWLTWSNAGLTRGDLIVSWGDYDNDGDLDILSAGNDQVGKIYRNDGNNIFTDINVDLNGGANRTGPAYWGDFDNDGDLDVVRIRGLFDPAVLYINEDGDQFIETSAGLSEIGRGGAAAGDFDLDFDLDLLFAGADGYYTGPELTYWWTFTSDVYRNENSSLNDPPGVPTGLSALVMQNSVRLSWHRSIDNQTLSPGLTYNLRMGISPNGIEVVSPMSDPVSGQRLIAQRGNADHDTSWTIKNLTPGTYYWSVQAIDHSFVGSAFAPEDSFVITPVGIGHTDINIPDKFVLYQNYPNPFNNTTVIPFQLSTPAFVRLSIFDVQGRLINTLRYEKLPPGDYTSFWDGTDRKGEPVSSGIYFYRLTVRDSKTNANHHQTHKMLYLQ